MPAIAVTQKVGVPEIPNIELPYLVLTGEEVARTAEARAEVAQAQAEEAQAQAAATENARLRAELEQLRRLQS